MASCSSIEVGSSLEDKIRASSSEKHVSEGKKRFLSLDVKADRSSGSDDDQQSSSSENRRKRPKVKHLPDSKELEVELNAGHPTDLFGINQHYSYPSEFKDLGRRFVLQYPYKEITQDSDKDIIPIRAEPEEVLKAVISSAVEAAAEPDDDQDGITQEEEKKILRTGDYWNSVWVEEVDPDTVLRSRVKKNRLRDEKIRSSVPKLSSVKAKIMPGSKLYELISVLKQRSPKLLYVINRNN